ncbi:arrestin domain-containing protein 3-like [Paralichthys olivaceus]|uniref:arrestin domain-containing protein 3-like n=1 Tax=Paralichthys olivaceus TaxID=8255 RepID=UPI00097DB779|nr:PREDICTED: arrestin domain-containing protein 3-like [Paralichthys olivaceus]
MLEQTIKNFCINFNAVNESRTFSSGQLVTGHFSFDLTKKTKITDISMRLKGHAHVHWSTGGGKNRSRRHFSGKITYFDLKGVILHGNSAIGGSMKLQPGTHMYPFTCQIPQGDFPSSFKDLHGRIEYVLTMSINRPWRVSKDFVTELNFINHINTNQPELHAPLKGSNQMTVCCLWCASPPITMTVSVEKKAFTPGETVKIICEFSNSSSRTATPRARLLQKQTLYTNERAHKRKYEKNLASVVGQPIDAQTCDVHTEMMIVIPQSASFTIANCNVLVIDYVIEVSLRVRCASDLTVLFPIILCDTPVHPQPPPYE